MIYCDPSKDFFISLLIRSLVGKYNHWTRFKRKKPCKINLGVFIFFYWQKKSFWL